MPPGLECTFSQPRRLRSSESTHIIGEAAILIKLRHHAMNFIQNPISVTLYRELGVGSGYSQNARKPAGSNVDAFSWAMRSMPAL